MRVVQLGITVGAQYLLHRTEPTYSHQRAPRRWCTAIRRPLHAGCRLWGDSKRQLVSIAKW